MDNFVVIIGCKKSFHFRVTFMYQKVLLVLPWKRFLSSIVSRPASAVASSIDWGWFVIHQHSLDNLKKKKQKKGNYIISLEEENYLCGKWINACKLTILKSMLTQPNAVIIELNKFQLITDYCFNINYLKLIYYHAILPVQ